MTRLMGQALLAFAMIAAAAWVIVVAKEFPAGGDIMPVFCATGVIGLSLFMLLEAVWRHKSVLQEKLIVTPNYSKIKPYILLVVSIIYFIYIFILGYYVSTILFLIIASYIIGVRKYKFILATAAVLLPAMYAFFELFLQARLPTGWLI
jgi:hypothetical protein